ncbi:MAG TPA: DUF2334 domain-containing protein [Thermoanaerobaculaceae bacterium]|nr:DUF2334 domain-containing protein [Thermoanaerobaculaceae bacterium]
MHPRPTFVRTAASRVARWAALATCLATSAAGATAPAAKTVLVLYEPGPVAVASGLGDARQLRQLLGHFHADVTLQSADTYRAGELAAFDVAFYIGWRKDFRREYAPAPALYPDVFESDKTFVWINSGLDQFARTCDLESRFGFRFLAFDTTSGYDQVDAGGNRFTKTEPNANVIEVTDKARCQVLATATSTRRRVTIPYLVRSGNFWCVVDSPFSYATEADRYLYFADLLHDILGEDHPRSLSAAIRIEDTNPLSDPSSLRAVADVLAARKMPFMVGVIPFYVNPAAGMRVAMSEKPDYVDAIKYMMEHGGTVVLHGTTHQYHGESASDYEYWDESRDKVLPSDSQEFVAHRLREGVVECVKNGIYPLLWETPHYSASEVDYSAFAQVFSAATEQRLVLDRLDYSQFFPYVIYKDMYGQKIYPENLGYIPLDADPAKELETADRLVSFAKANLAVRDSFVCAFFHPFVKIEALERLVDGIRALGYTFVDIRDNANTVTLEDRAIVSGGAKVALNLTDQYLLEQTFDENGRLVRRELSTDRFAGPVERDVKLPPRWIWVAEPREYRERTLSLWERARSHASELIHQLERKEESHRPADALFLFDPHATAGAANDQASLAAPLLALGIPVEQVALTPSLALDFREHNLVLVPYNVAEALTDRQLESLKGFVAGGGNLVTDFRNPLAEALGVHFLASTVLIERVRDRLFPEETLHWGTGEVMNKFDTVDGDDVLASDEVSEFPVAFARSFGKGKFIFFGTRFDPASTGGFSRFPYLAHDLRRVFALTPLVRREELEMYFDPGFRHTVSVEQLASRWAAQGVRVIHVGGWHEYPKYTYDYARLIRLCHANGILVYAWLEPPQVSQKFWLDHPEWREKNFKGQDVQPSWRYPVALTDPACLEATLAFYRKLLRSFDWDGVNIAELYFEAGRGMRDPQLVTPMHPSARAEFRKLAGFDPIELFEPTAVHYFRRDPGALAAFTRYRVGKIVALHDAMLTLADSIASGRPGFQVMVTVLDNLAAPELKSYLGVDTRQIAALHAKHNFVLQVEDPETMWSSDPRRYEAIAARYAGLVPPQDLALDLNILPFRKDTAITPFPTRVQTGAESFWLVNSAARGAPRVTIYSEAHVNPQDLAFLSSAYAARTKLTKVEDGWAVVTPTPIVLQLASDVTEVWRDEQRIRTVGDGRFLLPAGSYTVLVVQPAVRALQPEVPEARLLSITGDLLAQKSSLRSVQFRYRSGTRCIASLTREPFAVFVDGRETAFDALKGDGRESLLLPPGEHEVLVVTQSTVSYGVDLTSFWSSYVIALFGAVSVGLLATLYLVVRLRLHTVGQAS